MLGALESSITIGELEAFETKEELEEGVENHGGDLTGALPFEDCEDEAMACSWRPEDLRVTKLAII